MERGCLLRTWLTIEFALHHSILFFNVTIISSLCNILLLPIWKLLDDLNLVASSNYYEGIQVENVISF